MVAIDTFMDRKDTATETKGRINRPMDFNPSNQNLQLGILDRSIPKNWKFITNRPSAPVADWRDVRLSLVTRDSRYSWL